MAKIKYDGKEIEVSEDAVQTIADAEAKRKADASEIQELTEQVSSLTTERDELQGKYDAQNVELENYRKEAAQAKLDSFKKEAAEHVPAEKLDSLDSEVEVKKAVIAAKFDGEDLSEKSDGYIDGMYKAAIKMPAQPTSTNLQKIDSATGQGNPLRGVDLIDAARKQNLEQIRG